MRYSGILKSTVHGCLIVALPDGTSQVTLVTTSPETRLPSAFCISGWTAPSRNAEEDGSRAARAADVIPSAATPRRTRPVIATTSLVCAPWAGRALVLSRTRLIATPYSSALRKLMVDACRTNGPVCLSRNWGCDD